jgi:hypothetical protein
MGISGWPDLFIESCKRGDSEFVQLFIDQELKEGSLSQRILDVGLSVAQLGDWHQSDYTDVVEILIKHGASRDLLEQYYFCEMINRRVYELINQPEKSTYLKSFLENHKKRLRCIFYYLQHVFCDDLLDFLFDYIAYEPIEIRSPISGLLHLSTNGGNFFFLFARQFSVT